MALRIYIEDVENNFLYLDVHPNDQAAEIIALVNRASNGVARIEREIHDREEIEAIIYDRPSRRTPSSSIRTTARSARRRRG